MEAAPPITNQATNSRQNTDWGIPIAWLSYLYTSFLYYLRLIVAHLPHLPQRITDDKSAEQIKQDADGIGSDKTVSTDEKTQTAMEVAGQEGPAPKDSSLLPPPPPSFDYCNNCLTPHSSQKTCSPSYVSSLSLSKRRSSKTSKKKPSPFSSITSSTVSTTSSASIRSPSPASSELSATSTISPSKIIAVVPSGCHVLVGVPKLDWKTESIRVKRTRMSDWLDAEQRDVMRQFDEVIRNEEEAEDQKTSQRRTGARKAGIIINGSFRSVGSLESSTSRPKETPVFVPPPPPPTDTMLYLPRLVELQRSSPTQEFGFNLHAERGRGHFIGTVDQGGIGEKAGLEAGQRIVGVNGELTYPSSRHRDVVALIKQDSMKTTLLVVSEEVDKYHKDNNIAYSWDNVDRIDTLPPPAAEKHHHHHHHEEEEEEDETPVAASKANGYDVAPPLNPHSIQVNEEREVSKITTTTKTETISTSNASYQYKESTTAYDAYGAQPPVAVATQSPDLMDQVFAKVDLPAVDNRVIITSHTKELSTAEDASSISSLTSSHNESAVDVPVPNKYVPSYATQSHQQHEQQSQTNHHHHHHHHQQQPSPLSNGSSHGYAASSTSGYDDDDIYHLPAREARERLRMKNRKHHLHDMSLNEKYQLVSNM